MLASLQQTDSCSSAYTSAYVISMCCVPAACLQPEGLKEMYGLINFYKENAKILKDTFTEMGFSVYGKQPELVGLVAQWQH